MDQEVLQNEKKQKQTHPCLIHIADKLPIPLALWNEWALIWKAITYPCPNLEKDHASIIGPDWGFSFPWSRMPCHMLTHYDRLMQQGISSNDIDSESLRWCQNAWDSVSNRQPNDCFLTFIQTQIKESIKAPCHWPLCGEFTGDRWILRTNG